MRKLGKVSKRFLAFFLAASLAMPMSNYFMPIAYAEEYNDQGESTVKDVTTEVTEEVVTTSEEVTSEEVTSEEASGEDTSEDKTSEDETSEDETSEDKTSEDETTQQKTTEEDKADKATVVSEAVTFDSVISEGLYSCIESCDGYWDSNDIENYKPANSDFVFDELKLDEETTLNNATILKFNISGNTMQSLYLNGTNYVYVKGENEDSFKKVEFADHISLYNREDSYSYYYIVIDNADNVEYKGFYATPQDMIDNNCFLDLDAKNGFNYSELPSDRITDYKVWIGTAYCDGLPSDYNIAYGAFVARIKIPADGIYQFAVQNPSEDDISIRLYTFSDNEPGVTYYAYNTTFFDNRDKDETYYYVVIDSPQLAYLYSFDKVGSLDELYDNAKEIEVGTVVNVEPPIKYYQAIARYEEYEWDDNRENFERIPVNYDRIFKGHMYKVDVRANEEVYFTSCVRMVIVEDGQCKIDIRYSYNRYISEEDRTIYIWLDGDECPDTREFQAFTCPEYIDVYSAEELTETTEFTHSNTDAFTDEYVFKDNSGNAYREKGKLFKIPESNYIKIESNYNYENYIFDADGSYMGFYGDSTLHVDRPIYVLVKPQICYEDWSYKIIFEDAVTLSGIYRGDFPDIVESATEISGDYECTELDCNVLLDISEIRNFHGNSCVQANLYKVKVPAGKMMDISSVNDSNNLVYGKYPDYSVIDTTGQTYNMLDAVSSIIVDNTNGDDMWYYFACLADWDNQYGTISCKVLNDFSGEKQKIEAVDGIYSIHIEDFENQKSDYFFDGRAQSGILYELEIPANTTVLNVTEPTCVYSAVAMEESANDFNYINDLVYANQGNEIKKLCLFVTYVGDNSMDITLKQEHNVYSYFDNALLIDDNYTTSLVVDENLSNYAKSFVGSLSAEGLLFKLEGGYIYDVTTYKMEYSDSITELQIYNEDGTPYDDIKLGVSPSPCGTNATGIKVPEGSFVYVWAGINPYCGPQSTSELISFERKAFVEAESLEVYYQGKKVEDTLHFSQGEGIVQFTVKTVPENAYVQYFACYTEDQSVIVTRDDGSCKLNGAGETDIVFEESFSGLSTSIHVVVDELKFIDEMVDEATPLESGTYTFTEDQYTKYYQDVEIDGEVFEGPFIGKGKLYKLVLPAGYKANITTDSVQFLEFQNVANKTVDFRCVGAYIAENSTEEEKVYYLWASAAPGEHESLSFTVAIEPIKPKEVVEPEWLKSCIKVGDKYVFTLHFDENNSVDLKTLENRGFEFDKMDVDSIHFGDEKNEYNMRLNGSVLSIDRPVDEHVCLGVFYTYQCDDVSYKMEFACGKSEPGHNGGFYISTESNNEYIDDEIMSKYGLNNIIAIRGKLLFRKSNCNCDTEYRDDFFYQYSLNISDSDDFKGSYYCVDEWVDTKNPDKLDNISARIGGDLYTDIIMKEFSSDFKDILANDESKINNDGCISLDINFTNDEVKIPSYIFDDIKYIAEKYNPINVIFGIYKGRFDEPEYIWHFNAESDLSIVKDFDSKVTIIDLKKDDYSAEKKNILKQNFKSLDNILVADFSYEGQLPKDTEIVISTKGKFGNKSPLYLYYFNQKNKELTEEQIILNYGDNYLNLPISHCSEYVISDKPMEKIIPLQSIAFNGVPNPVTLDIGKTYSDAASKIKKTPSDTTAEVVIEWTSSNPKIAKVDTKGKVTAVAPGNATITAKVKGDTKLASFNVKVNPKLVTSVALDKKTASVIEGDSIKLVAKVSPADATNKKVTWKSSNTKVAKVDANGKITAVAPGTADITVTSADGSKKSATCKITVTKKQAPKVDVSYSTHIQSFSWEKVYKKNGALSGTTGLGKRLEAIKIKVSGNKNLGIQYTTHCQSYGWLTWSCNDEISGTSSEGKRLEAIMIQLTGKDKDKYDVYYRVHAQSYGWLAWAKNGEASGTAGFGKRLEAIQIAVVRKGDAFDKNMGGIKSSNSKAYVTGSSAEKKPVVKGSSVPHVTYQSHVQSYGWQKWVSDGVMSGTSGESKRLEGMRIKITNCDYSGDIVYDTHVQSYGWLGKGNNTSTWSKNGAMSGTTGKGKRLEAIKIKLTGEMAKHYDVYYRVHAQSYGWLAWAKNGEESGTAGYSKRLEGIQIVLVKKGDKAPSKNYGGITSKQNKAFIKK